MRVKGSTLLLPARVHIVHRGVRRAAASAILRLVAGDGFHLVVGFGFFLFLDLPHLTFGHDVLLRGKPRSGVRGD